MIPTNEAELDKIIAERQITLPSTSAGKQIVIYLVSFLFPPFGLTWGLKYIRIPDPKVKKIGLIAIILTIVSIILTFWISKTFVDKYAHTLDSINEEMKIGDFNY
jgi:hypothetical protein